jgi:hypothetical protein
VRVEYFIILSSDTIDPEMVAFARRDETSVKAHTSRASAAFRDGAFVAQITAATVEPLGRITSRPQRHLIATFDLLLARVLWSNGHDLELEIDRMTERIGREVMAFLWSALWGAPHSAGTVL